MSALATILVGVATKVGAPIVAGILRDAIGGKAGDLAGDVIETIAGRAGTTPEALPEMAGQDPERIERAVLQAEADTPALVLAHVESQRLAIELQLAEMSGGKAWTWAWRPAWMYFLMAAWGWTLLAVALQVPAIDLPMLMTLTGAYLALYMGGHTVKDVAGKRRGGHG